MKLYIHSIHLPIINNKEKNDDGISEAWLKHVHNSTTQ